MSAAEPARHQLHQWLEEVLGPDEAETLMAHLPPLSWSELATKEDLARHTDRLEARLDRRIDQVDARIDRLEASTIARFDQIDARFNHHESRFDAIDARFDRLEARFSQVERAGHDLRLDLAEVRIEMADMRGDFHSTMRTNAYLILGGVSALMIAMSTISQVF